MILYVSISFAKLDLRKSKVLLGNCGILGVILAIVMAFGICGYLQVTFSPAVIAVPFLILGIGTDDMVPSSKKKSELI